MYRSPRVGASGSPDKEQPQGTQMISVAQAADLTLAHTHCLGEEWLSLAQVAGRTLAEAIAAPQDFPAAPTSSMDGYAVRASDLSDLPCTLDIVEVIPAGKMPQESVAAGQAARLFTGSVVPPGADTVIAQEDTQVPGPGRVTIRATYDQGRFVRPQGQFCRRGELLLSSGQLLGGPEVAVLAAVQRSHIQVYQRPRVAILSTGDELTRLDQPLGPGQIVDSNQHGLATLVQLAGGLPMQLGIVPDTDSPAFASGRGGQQKLKQAIAHAVTTADVVLSSGGVSVGDYDYVASVLEDLGGQVQFRRVAIKPGKPLTFATFRRPDPLPLATPDPDHLTPSRPVLYFGLPGNPVSAMVCFWRFVEPVLQKLQGRTALSTPRFITALTQAPLKGDGQRETYLWGQITTAAGQKHFIPVNEHGSGNLINLAGTNALAVVPVGQVAIAPGSAVSVLLPMP